MTFTTLTFLIFLALFFPLYWALRRRRAQNVLIVVASYIFYGWWDWRFCGLMLAASLLDFGVGLGLERTDVSRRRKCLLALGLTANLGLLACFKYFNFFAESLQAAAATVGWTMDMPTLKVVPLTSCASSDPIRPRCRAIRPRRGSRRRAPQFSFAPEALTAGAQPVRWPPTSAEKT